MKNGMAKQGICRKDHGGSCGGATSWDSPAAVLCSLAGIAVENRWRWCGSKPERFSRPAPWPSGAARALTAGPVKRASAPRPTVSWRGASALAPPASSTGRFVSQPSCTPRRHFKAFKPTAAHAAPATGLQMTGAHVGTPTEWSLRGIRGTTSCLSTCLSSFSASPTSISSS